MQTIQLQIPNGYKLIQVSEGKWEIVKSDKDVLEILSKDNVSLISTNLCFTNALDLEQRKKLFNRFIALSQLQCVADHLNEGWQPNWEESDYKWFITYDTSEGENRLIIEDSTYLCSGQVIFKTKELAQRAIEICGDNIIKKALGV